VIADHALLERIEQRIRRRRSELRLRPGCDDERLREQEQRLGSDLSREARTWWTWRDGSQGEFALGLWALPLEAAVGLAQERRAWVRRLVADPDFSEPINDPEFWWSAYWLPIFETSGPHVLVLDLSGDSNAGTPVRQIDWELVPEPTYKHELAPSLGAWILGAMAKLE